jgi:RNA polymerase sigma factor (TIGR02999 family)
MGPASNLVTRGKNRQRFRARFLDRAGRLGSRGKLCQCPTIRDDAVAPPIDELFPELYAELRRIAHAHRRRHGRHETLSTTALVNEAYVRLKQGGRLGTKDRLHFLALSARAMRFILIDYARSSSTEKRSPEPAAEAGAPADPAGIRPGAEAETLLALDAALQKLTALNDRMARVVECRFFGGMTEEEIAELLGVSERTVRGDWQRAKIWLARDLGAPLAEP